jgi:hypothetical protein
MHAGSIQFSLDFPVILGDNCGKNQLLIRNFGNATLRMGLQKPGFLENL